MINYRDSRFTGATFDSAAISVTVGSFSSGSIGPLASHCVEDLLGEDLQLLLVEGKLLGAHIVRHIGVDLLDELRARQLLQQSEIELINYARMQLELFRRAAWVAWRSDPGWALRRSAANESHRPPAREGRRGPAGGTSNKKLISRSLLARLRKNEGSVSLSWTLTCRRCPRPARASLACSTITSAAFEA
jgi:hypothetical protein